MPETVTFRLVGVGPIGAAVTSGRGIDRSQAIVPRVPVIAPAAISEATRTCMMRLASYNGVSVGGSS